MANGFSPSVWDRLIGDPVDVAAAGNAAQLTLAQLKGTVARDLAALLNTRTAISPDVLTPFPACEKSLLNYGLTDFAGLCLTSSADRQTLCLALKAAIERHEPRLANVRTTLSKQRGHVNRLHFHITAALIADAGESVSFDGMLQPSTLHYSVQ